jgi:glycosyltransferase involved in cell wall biosynthesis
MAAMLALIPAFNEEARVADVVAAAQQHLAVLVVDDGSSDRTAERAEQAGAWVLRYTPNRGKGVALQTGFRWALKEGYQAVVMLDADGQHDPAEIPTFMDAYAARPADLIIGARDFSQIPVVRRFANTAGRWSFSWALGQPVPDNQSGYRLVSRRLMEATLESKESGFYFEVEMILICVEQGFGLTWVPISTIYSGEKSHIRPVSHVFNFVRLVWQTRRRMQRLKREGG